MCSRDIPIPTSQLLGMRQDLLKVRSRHLVERNLERDYKTFSEEDLNRIIDEFDIQHANVQEVDYFSEERIDYEVAQRVLRERLGLAF